MYASAGCQACAVAVTRQPMRAARRLLSTTPSGSGFSATSPPRGVHDAPGDTSTPLAPRGTAQSQLTSLLSTLNLSARARARAFSSALAALELERKLSEVGGRINQATGYEQIERLRLGVAEREKALLDVRELASVSKKSYSTAVTLRATSQREVNDLLSRKSSWSSQDVVRFTELVRQDHDNAQAENLAKGEMDKGEEGVEKGFSDLMQAILERYHEEQVWSDKIRSLSTYGSLAITSLNVFLFVVTILLVEPWKRKRLVEGVEARLRQSTNTSNEATVSSITSLQTLLTDAQDKLDLLLLSPALSPPPPLSAAAVDDLTDELLLDIDVVATDRAPDRERRDRELMIGAGGAAVGIGLSLLLGLVGR